MIIIGEKINGSIPVVAKAIGERDAEFIKARAIAQDKAVTSILSQDFISRHNLPAASSVSLALKTLINREFIYKYNGSYIIYDRFFGMWLRKNCAGN